MKLILKILAWPVTLALSALTWIGAFALSRAAFLFELASALISTLAMLVFLSGSMKNALILTGIAVLISPLGLPMLAAKLLAGLAMFNGFLKNRIYG